MKYNSKKQTTHPVVYGTWAVGQQFLLSLLHLSITTRPLAVAPPPLPTTSVNRLLDDNSSYLLLYSLNNRIIQYAEGK